MATRQEIDAKILAGKVHGGMGERFTRMTRDDLLAESKRLRANLETAEKRRGAAITQDAADHEFIDVDLTARDLDIISMLLAAD